MKLFFKSSPPSYEESVTKGSLADVFKEKMVKAREKQVDELVTAVLKMIEEHVESWGMETITFKVFAVDNIIKWCLENPDIRQYDTGEFKICKEIATGGVALNMFVKRLEGKLNRQVTFSTSKSKIVEVKNKVRTDKVLVYSTDICTFTVKI